LCEIKVKFNLIKNQVIIMVARGAFHPTLGVKIPAAGTKE